MSSATSVVPLPYTREQLASLLGPNGEARLLEAYRWMTLGRTLDTRLLALQRQGRVGFYGAATGQEAVNVAAGLASSPADWVLPGLREQLVALVRGHPLGAYVHHLFADARDPALGRNMPCHPTAREVHYVSMSSVIGTQITHAVGVAFGLRHAGERAVALAFFGDGATSSNDFHAGLNFAAVRGLPVLFACTNNQWAISVPVRRQTAVPHLAVKARAYGLEGRTVDGTDLIACWSELSGALARLRAGGAPEMLEFVLYRMTAHSSSDDPSRYQPADWPARAQAYDPLARLQAWMLEHRLLDRAAVGRVETEVDSRVREAITAAEGIGPPPSSSLTEDVFAAPRSGRTPQ
jgi:pyruvate dehydrogenase E1 component subunit alpha